MPAQAYHPIPASDDDHHHDIPSAPKAKRPYLLYSALIFTTLSLLFTNCFWFYHHTYHCSNTPFSPLPSTTLLASKNSTSPSYWPTSHLTTSKPLHWNTSFSSPNKNLSSPLWRSLFPPAQGIVTLPSISPLIPTLSLPPSIPNPLNDSEVVYFVAAYHQLHCLTVIRSTLYKYKEGRVQGDGDTDVKWNHAVHCLDSLRQAVICRADDTLLATRDGSVFGDGQERICRDWEGLREWVERNE